MRNAFVEILIEEAKRDSNIILLTADLGFGFFEEFQEKFPNQFINVGVAEQSLISVATGLALEGFRTVAYSLGNFPTLRCYEQIRNDACYHDVNMTIVASGGGFSYGQLGMSHHATEDIAVMRAMPGVDVCVPFNAWHTKLLFRHLLNQNNVSYLRLDKSSAALPISYSNRLLPNQIVKVSDGNDFTIITSGGISQEVLDANELLLQQGIHVRILFCGYLTQIDEDIVLRACEETGGILTVEEHSIIGGLSSAVAELCIRNGVVPKKFDSIAMKNGFSSVVGDQKFLRKYYSMDSVAILKSITNLLLKEVI